MHFEPTPYPQDLTPEQRTWLDRFVATIPALEAMDDDRRVSFDHLTDQVLAEQFGSFPVVAEVLETGEPTIEVLPFLVPIVEGLLAHLADGTLVETDEAWVLIDDSSDTDLLGRQLAEDLGIDPELVDLEMDAAVLGITDMAIAERFEVAMMELRGLEPDHRAAVVDTVFDLIENNFMEHPGIAAYYATARPNPEAAFVIVPLFEAVLAGNRTFDD